MFSNIKQKITSLFRSKKYREEKYITPLMLNLTSAIHALSTNLQADSDALEVYIALANLYRIQGDIEKALQIHARLLVRNDITNSMKALLYAELGKDYHISARFDRALASYIQAKELGYCNERFLYDMMDVYDMLHEYEQAAKIAKEMREPLSQAYYLSKQSMQNSALNPPRKEDIKKILAISPELVQGWFLLLCLYSTTETLEQFRSTLIQALNYITIPFLLLELYVTSSVFQSLSLEEKTSIVENIALVIKEHNDNFLLFYYLGLLYCAIDDTYHAIASFERSLQIKNDFWAPQYELFSLGLPSFSQDDIFKNPANFFIEYGKKHNRFICSVCSLETNTAFSLCTRCKYIQSIAFRVDI